MGFPFLIIITVAVQAYDNVRVLPDSAGLTAGRKAWAAYPDAIRWRDSCDGQMTGTFSSLAMIFSIRLISLTARSAALVRPAVPAAGGLHQLEVVNDHKVEVRQAAALGVHVRHRERRVIIDADIGLAEGLRGIGNISATAAPVSWPVSRFCDGISARATAVS